MSKIYFGYDESNNGNIPEFHVLTFTHNVENVRKPLFKLFKGKEKKEKPNLLSDELNSKKITFRFLVLFKEDLIRINKFMDDVYVDIQRDMIIF